MSKLISRLDARNSFVHTSTTFGLGTKNPWALPALRLLMRTPRLYDPLVAAWNFRFRNTRSALKRLVDLDFVAYQEPIIVDTLTNEIAPHSSVKLLRYVTTGVGQRYLAQAAEDFRFFEDRFAHLDPETIAMLYRMLVAAVDEAPVYKVGVSQAYLSNLSPIPDRTARWWVRRLVTLGLLRELPERIADTRELVPAHYRPGHALIRQLHDVIEGLDTVPNSLHSELRTNRKTTLEDIDTLRISSYGATDYAHDITLQRALAALVRSPKFLPSGLVSTEPIYKLAAHRGQPMVFEREGADITVRHQPDASYYERTETGQVQHVVVEYERNQSRRDGWAHIEKALGHFHHNLAQGVTGTLRFIVDTPNRARSYTELIEAVATHLDEQPHLAASSDVVLSVISLPELLAASDPLDPAIWASVRIPGSPDGTPVLHNEGYTPYEDFFGLAWEDEDLEDGEVFIVGGDHA